MVLKRGRVLGGKGEFYAQRMVGSCLETFLIVLAGKEGAIGTPWGEVKDVAKHSMEKLPEAGSCLVQNVNSAEVRNRSVLASGLCLRPITSFWKAIWQYLTTFKIHY